MKSSSASSSTSNANKTSSFGVGGSRSGGKQQQTLTQLQQSSVSSAGVTSTGVGTNQQPEKRSSSQPKPNAWSKPLQASAPKNSTTISPPPGLTGSTNSSNARDVTTTVSSGSSSGVKPRPNSDSSTATTSIPSYNAGAASGSSGTNGSALMNSTSLATEIALRERFVHLVTVLTGQKVTVTLKSGVVVTGILHTATPFAHLPASQRNKYVLRAVTIDKHQQESSNDTSTPPITPGQTLILDMSTVAQLHLKSIRMDQLVGNTTSNSNGDAFVTDTEISKAAANMTGPRELVQAGSAWTRGGKDISLNETGLNGSTAGTNSGVKKSFSRSSSGDDLPINSRAAKLAGASAIGTSSSKTNFTSNSTGDVLKGSIAGWDQFKANEELFNVTGGYDETVYTTPLDKSSLEAEKILRAEKIAREIESTATQNPHLAEERGQIAIQADYEDELDEEDRYSGVLSKNPRVGTDLLTKSTIAITPQTSKVVASSTTQQTPDPGTGATITTAAPKAPPSSNAPQQAKPKLNYAQAAAKQSVTSKPSTTPPGFAAENKTTAAKPTATPPNTSTLKKEAQSLEDSSLSVKKEVAPTKAEELPEVKESEEIKAPVKLASVEPMKEENLSAPSEAEIIEPLKEDLVQDDLASPETKAVTETPAKEDEEQETEESKKDKEGTESKPASEESKQQQEDATSSAASKSKLNVNAKEFTLNFSAKPFTPHSAVLPSSQSQHQQPPPMPLQPQHLQPQQHHQFQPQYFDPHTGMPIPIHAVPPYAAAGHMQPHHGPMATHHMMGAHMMTVQPHYPGQYPGMRAYPGQYAVDPHIMQQQPQQAPPSMHQGAPPPPPPPPPPPTANNTAPTTASTVTSTHTSGATTPVVSDDGGESPSQPAVLPDGSETQPLPPQQQTQQPQPMQIPTHMQWHQQQAAAAAAYYGAPMHLQPQQQTQQPHQQRIGPGAGYPPQPFMHHPQMTSMGPMRPHHMYGPPMVAGVAPPPPQMRGSSSGVPGVGGGGSVMPYYPGPPTHMGGPYQQPYNTHVGAAAGTPVGGGYGGGADDDGQGGYGGRGRGRDGGRGRGRSGRGRGGRGRAGGGRFNSQPFQGHGGLGSAQGGNGSQPGSGRQTPQSGPIATEDGKLTGEQGPALSLGDTIGSTVLSPHNPTEESALESGQ